MVVRCRGIEVRVRELIGGTVHPEDLDEVAFTIGWLMAQCYEFGHIFK
jgi:hypothetical protein